MKYAMTPANSMSASGASAAYAEASSCCARAAANTVSLLMDAIVMASILICALLSLSAILALNMTLLVLALVLVLPVGLNHPLRRRRRV